MSYMAYEGRRQGTWEEGQPGQELRALDQRFQFHGSIIDWSASLG
ncbi:hypothetical protein RRG08_012824 [Elysia crispata]|uniref:Uncharacterized protein n=1 Tax=Elysia crispata TaxID=231223 RepID=A0AAE0XY48_9GAST|nr:hypothetical protein RRG08_012824 [Elysia crispata]